MFLPVFFLLEKTLFCLFYLSFLLLLFFILVFFFFFVLQKTTVLFQAALSVYTLLKLPWQEVEGELNQQMENLRSNRHSAII